MFCMIIVLYCAFRYIWGFDFNIILKIISLLLIELILFVTMYYFYSKYNEEIYENRNGYRDELIMRFKDLFIDSLIEYDVSNKYYRSYENLKNLYHDDNQTFWFYILGGGLFSFLVIYFVFFT